MTTARRKVQIQPYNLTWAQVAEAVFQRSESWLRANIERLMRDQGFPKPDPRMDHVFNRMAVESWIDGPYGFSSSSVVSSDQAMMEEAARGA